MILAHREEYENGIILEQPLIEHLYEVGKRAGEIGREIGLEYFMKLAGYLHDIGKADRSFQKYIRGQKQQINHSSAGGRILNDYINSIDYFTNLVRNKEFRYFKEVIFYIIFAHHGLFDQITYGSTEHNTYLRLSYDKEGNYHYSDDIVPFLDIFLETLKEKNEKPFADIIILAFDEFKLVYSKLSSLVKNKDKENEREEKEYYISCLTRLCLSILKEADIYDASNAFRNHKQHLCDSEDRSKVWKEITKHIEYMYQEYESEQELSELNKARNSLARLVKESAIANDNGIFKLEMPTGSGKTKAGLRYSLNNALKYNRNRIFYITAYLSVLEQNAADIRRIVNWDDIVLEHHSNMTDDIKYNFDVEDNAEYEVKEYLKDSWENLIILTTMVQFFNTLFKEKSSNIRRFCKLINSVIIIDEVQSLPLKVLSNFNLMMNFMKEIMHCNIVHCTATQPVLDSVAMRYKIYYGDKEDNNATIISNEQIDMKCFHRVDYYNLTGKDGRRKLSTEELFEYIETELKLFDSCLVVLNTKAAVASLYDYLNDNLSGVEIVYLTTNLCAEHRLDIISDMKLKLLQNRMKNRHNKIVCVSTQLIEAGVDVDFDIVFRTLAGVDSLIQCGGRCNREGKLMINGKYVTGKVYIFRYSEEDLSYLPDIKAETDATEYAIRMWCQNNNEDEHIKPEELQNIYFNKYYIENRNNMDYIDKKRNSSMLEELGRNQPAREAYSLSNNIGQKPVMYQAFKTAAENFELIGQETVGVIVVYKNQDLLDQLEKAMMEHDYKNVKETLTKLQPYTVNMYITPQLQPFIIKNTEYNVYFLQKEYYDEIRGVIIDKLADLII